MDSQTTIEYEIVNPATDQGTMTDSHDEALAYFEKDWIIYEHHITVTRLKYTSTRVDVATIWNDNPELSKE